MSEIVINNIGRIKQAAFPYPDGGGVVVLYGRNGAGKSTALKAVERLATNRGDLPVRDGAKSGFVDGLGVHITVGKSTRRTGQLEVTSLEGRFDVSTFVDPGLKSEDAADAARIRALCSLLGLGADAKLFEPLVPGVKLDDVASPSALLADDLVDQAAKMKRDFEAASRKEEDKARNANAKGNAIKQQIESVSMNVETDATNLQDALRSAIEEHARIVQQRKAGIENEVAIKEAKRNIDDAKANLDAAGQLDELQALQTRLTKELEQRKASVETALVLLEEAKQRLRDAEKNVESCGNQLDSVTQRIEAANQMQAVIQKWTATIEKVGGGECPSEDDERTAADAVKVAQQAIEAGAVAREALRKADEAEQHLRDGMSATMRAETFRDAAKATDGVLSDAIAHDRLRIVAGRIVLDTDRGETPFSDLSPGERWPIAIEIAAKRVGKGGLIVIPQEAWEGLDDANRSIVVDTTKRCGIVVYTAEAADSKTIVADVLETASVE